jgi:putative protease
MLIVFKPELLSPAGSLKNMRYAYGYGADAVYAGQPRYSLRVRNNEFDLANLAVGINEAHAQNKQFYVVSNISPHNAKLKTFMKDIEPVIDLKPDALIMSDPGLIMMVREQWPEVNIHLSVQANAVNWASVKFWQQMGLTRTILSRELSLDEIGQIRQQVPEMELEVFVHGALCMAYSGRCLLSGYMNKRDPNQGSCTNACRWKYDAHEAVETASGNVIPTTAVDTWTPEQGIEPTLGEGGPTDKMYLLQESGRPNDYMPAFEDEHGTYIMNSKDLRALHHVPKLAEMGVQSLKIEGRTKSHYYVARTAQAYRKAIDDAVAGKDFDKSGMDVLEGLANRGYTEGFYRRHVHDEYQNYDRGHSIPTSQQFVGEVIDQDDQRNTLTIEVKNRFELGDSVELMTSTGNVRYKLDSIENKKGKAIDAAPGSGHIVTIPKPVAGDVELGLLVRDL